MRLRGIRGSYPVGPRRTSLMRISAASICRIVIGGRLLLGLNKNSLRRGVRVLTPLGGAIECDADALGTLEGLGGRFEHGRDLRLTLSPDRLAEFEEWFRCRTQRETTPLRELREELLGEYKALVSLTVMSAEMCGTLVEDGISNRSGSQAGPTRRFLEVFAVTLTPENLRDLERFTSVHGAPLELVTKEEIVGGISGRGTAIAGLAKALLLDEN